MRDLLLVPPKQTLTNYAHPVYWHFSTHASIFHIFAPQAYCANDSVTPKTNRSVPAAAGFVYGCDWWHWDHCCSGGSRNTTESCVCRTVTVGGVRAFTVIAHCQIALPYSNPDNFNDKYAAAGRATGDEGLPDPPEVITSLVKRRHWRTNFAQSIGFYFNPLIYLVADVPQESAFGSLLLVTLTDSKKKTTFPSNKLKNI